MRPELVKAVDWWVKQRPQPSSPFIPENPHYSLQGHVLGDELSARTDRLFAQAKVNDDSGDRYTLITVFLATSLFLYGIAAVMHRYRVKVGLIGAGFAIFLVSLVCSPPSRRGS